MLSENHGRPFRIPYKKVRAAPPGGGRMMTSYPFGNKTSLSRKTCFPDKKSYYGTLWGSHGRSFRIHHDEVRAAPPNGGLTMTSYAVGNKTSLSRKTCIADKKVNRDHYLKVMVALSESVMKSRLKCPLAAISRLSHIRLAIQPRNLGNHESRIKS